MLKAVKLKAVEKAMGFTSLQFLPNLPAFAGASSLTKTQSFQVKRTFSKIPTTWSCDSTALGTAAHVVSVAALSETAFQIHSHVFTEND